MAFGRTLSFLSFVFLSCSIIELQASVPVLIWSKESFLNDRSQVLAGHTVSEKEFKNKFLDKIISSSKTICLFIQDRLSVDDLSRYGDAYGVGQQSTVLNNLRTAVEAANTSLVLPSVSSPTYALPEYIKNSVDGKVVEVNSADTKSILSIGDQKLDPSQTNVFIVHLKHRSESIKNTVANVLAENDIVIGQVLKELNSLGTPYTCVLTAYSPSQFVEEKQLEFARSTVVHDRLRRDVSADVSSNLIQMSNGTGTLIWTDCILLFVKKVSLTRDQYNLTGNVTKVSPNGFCNSTIQSIEFTAQNGSNSADFKVSFVKSGTSWLCKNIEVKGTPGGAEQVSCTSIQALQNMSFSCQDASFRYFKRSNQTSKTETVIKFVGFQVEAFTNTTNVTKRFHQASDCVGFFTIPIFMGLVTVGVLLTILFGGIIATMSITTMDRFDDPKGPGIQIGSTS